jgi:O-antigen/teichoic acid export membrane protein
LSSASDHDAPRGPRGARGYFAASAIAQVCALSRYVLLARLLGPEQLGLAAALILTGSFFDLISDTGGDRFLIQDKDGDQVRAQSLVQLVLVIRGVSIAVALAVFAWPIALFYKAPALGPGLAVLGLSPLIFGFLHLDMRRSQRHNDFRSEGVGMLASETLGLIATVVAAYFVRNFTAVLYGLIARSAVMVIVSHVFATRPYSIGYSPEHAPRLARFAAPLMVNGLTLFLGGQGDRVLVGRQVGFTGLGHYSAVLLLIYSPSAALLGFAHAIYLPSISAAREDRFQRDRVASDLGGRTLLLALAMSTGFAIVAPSVVGLLYGRAFSQSALIVALIGILQASRFLAVWPTTVALAMGRSSIILASNIVRLLAWPLAFLGFALVGGLTGVVIGFIGGELAAFSIALALLNRSESHHILYSFNRFLMFTAGSVGAIAWILVLDKPAKFSIVALACITAALVGWIVRSESVVIRDVMSTLKRLTVLKRI